MTGLLVPADMSTSSATTDSEIADPRFTPAERRSALSLSSLYALRMLGLFLVLPVFALEAAKYPGGDDPALIGLAMGIFGLTQGLLQIPFGMASDRFGRKPVIAFGLAVFALGSFIAAAAPNVYWLLFGRALQGAGAISAAVTALLADQTRDVVRTKAMAIVGATIGVMFALSLVAAPVLGSMIGLSGLFLITGILATLAIGVIVWITPPAPRAHADAPRGSLRDVLKITELLRLDFGVFALHAAQFAMWVALPGLLVSAGLAKADHWHIYLPTVLLSFGVMAVLFPLERRGRLKQVMLVAIAVAALTQLGFMAQPHSLWALALLLFVFFSALNLLEACLPSAVSRVAPAAGRGAALGVYNMLQSLGFFAGGAVGGVLAKAYGPAAVFVFAALLLGAWLATAWGMAAIKPTVTQHASAQGGQGSQSGTAVQHN
jgi:MFS family permease